MIKQKKKLVGAYREHVRSFTSVAASRVVGQQRSHRKELSAAAQIEIGFAQDREELLLFFLNDFQGVSGSY